MKHKKIKKCSRVLKALKKVLMGIVRIASFISDVMSILENVGLL